MLSSFQFHSRIILIEICMFVNKNNEPIFYNVDDRVKKLAINKRKAGLRSKFCFLEIMGSIFKHYVAKSKEIWR